MLFARYRFGEVCVKRAGRGFAGIQSACPRIARNAHGVNGAAGPVVLATSESLWRPDFTWQRRDCPRGWRSL